MVRILGPGHRRWRALLGTFFAAILLGLYAIPAAQAVHNVGVFELDTGASGANATNDPAVVGDDWDNVCHQVTGTDCSTTSNTTGATAVSWISEPDRNTTIFTGGGSKDPQDVSAWLWKDGAGGLPDKDNLRHAFAVRYSVPQTDPTQGSNPNDDGTCPAPSGPTCDVLYFGIDRFDNSGDAQLGFWFFQNAITADGPKSQGGNQFTGVHQTGDLLILSDFSVGGTTSTINIYEWVASGGDVSTHLLSLGGGGNKDCSVVTANDSFCGIVNKDPTPSTNPADDNTTSPWPFLDKSGNTSFAPAELYEGGVNLSSLGLGGECFASFDSESRSSTSPTATLKDFVLGGFGACNSSVASTQSWTPSDSATVTVSGKSTWTGSLTFKLFDNATCTGTALYTSDAIPVSNADATGTTDDSVTTPSAVDGTGGTFYWQVFFDSATTGVPDSTTCVEQSDLTIDNDNTV